MPPRSPAYQRRERDEMFGLFKAAVEIVKLPVDVAADVITLGGAINDKRETYTGKRCRRVMQKLDED